MTAKMFLRRLMGVFLAALMVLSLLPAQTLAAAAEKEWIIGFEDSAAAREAADSLGGVCLGGPFVLARASRTELESYPVVSLTANSSVEGCSVTQPSDPKASEQYILTHKSWYAQNAWAALESFLSSRETPLTPADCAKVRVAVLDSGIDATHEDLASRVTAGWDAVNRTPIAQGTNSDISGDSHGTKVAGLIGAASDNAVGIAGAAWTFPVELIPVRVLGSGNKGTVADVVAAIYWAVDEGDADILNLSFGQRLMSVPLAMQTAVLHAVENGVIVVAAAGNNSEYHNADNYYPAALDGVLPVGSTAKTLGSSYGNYNNYVQKADFSNKPDYESDCGKTFFFTPGESLLTTSAGNAYEEFTGTSASAALLSGMLAALKSCADATGRPAVENYLPYNKYSYLGGLYYQDYSAMADALAAGNTSDEVSFTADDNLPDRFKGTAKLSGILNDPAQLYTEVRLYIEGELVDSASRTEHSKQYIAFAVDTTAFEDGYYYSGQISLMGVLEDGAEQAIDHDLRFDICNDSVYYTVSVSCDGAPLVTGESYFFNGSDSWQYHTNNLGEFYLDPESVKEDASVWILGDNTIIYRHLTPYPAGDRWSFGNDPAILTVRCSEETLALVDGAAVYAAMPDGEQYQLGTVSAAENEFRVDTDQPITFTVCGERAILSQSFDLSGDDVIWDLDSTEIASITLTHDGKAPAEGTAGPVRFLGLEIDGFGEQLLDADGGSILVPPGMYSVTGYVYWWDGNYYSNYAKVDLGTHNVTEEGLTLTLGSGAPVASVSVDSETVTEGQSVSVTLSFADSSGNAIAELGSSDAECSYREKYRYIDLSIEEYDAESETWNEINQINLNQVPGSTTVNGGQLGTQPGQRRIVFCRENFISGLSMVDAMAEFDLIPQETRPAATVRLFLLDSYGNNIYGVSAATVLTDAEGNTIVREAYASEYGDEALIKLPIGETYSLAVMALDYSTAYMTTCTVDLTGSADGDEVYLPVAYDDSWIALEIPWQENDEVYFNVRNLAFTPFADFPAYKLTGAGTNGHIETLYTSTLAETKLYLDVMPDSYEVVENYEYPPVFTMKHEVDLSAAATLQVGLPKTITLTVETAADSAVLVPVITDAYGNEMTDAIYASRYGGIEGGDMVEGDMSGSKPVMVYPKVTVYNSDGEKVFEESTAFLPVTVEGLGEGTYAATVVWKSSDIDLTGEQVNFTIGAGGEEPPVIPMLQVPTAFRAAVAGGAVNLSWTAPANGCAGYLLLRDGEVLAELNGDAVTYTDNDAVGGGYHMYTLYAVDEEGRRSEAVTAGAAISAGADVEAPVWGSNAELTAEIGDGGVKLSWSRAQDMGSGVCGYLLLCDGEQIAQLFTRRYTASSLQPDVNHVFAVQAIDGAGNLSEPLTAEPVSVSSGILGAELDYARNRLGYMTGRNMTAQIKTTPDRGGVSVRVDFTRQDGSTGVLNPAAAGAEGHFAFQVTLPDDFVQVDQITVSSGEKNYLCLTAPILRCSSHVEIEVDLADAASIYPSAVLTLYTPAVGYAYSYPISNMTGTVMDNVIADDAYQLTLADSNGNVLLTCEEDLSADARITLNEEDVRFLQLAVEDGDEGLAVSVTTDGKTTSGKLDESGTVVWSSGGRFLSVGGSVTVRIPQWDHSEAITFDRLINQKTLRQGYKTISVPVTVLDTAGKGISGIEVQIRGSDVTETKTTDADGACVFTFVNSDNNVPMLSMQQQRDDQNRCWASLSIPVKGKAAVLRPVPMYEKIMIRPVLDGDVDPESVSFAVNEKPVSLKDGVLCAGKTDWWKTGERVIVSAEYTADGVTYVGRAGYDLTAQTETVGLAIRKGVEVAVSLSDGGDPLKGVNRYFAVYDSGRRLIAAFSTYQSSSAVALVEGEQYTVLGSWEKTPTLNEYYHSVRETVIAAEGCEVALDKSRISFTSYGLETLFMVENGFRSTPAVSVLDSGDIRVTLSLTAWPLFDTRITSAYNMLLLPAGVRDITSSEEYSIDEATGLMTLNDDLTGKIFYSLESISFTIPAERVPSEFLFQSLTRYRYDGVECLRLNNEFELAECLMQVDVPGRISASALKSDGLPLNVRLPFAGLNGKLEVYADDTLLTAVAADQYNKMVVHPENRLGDCTLRVVYTAENGFTLSREVTSEITADTRPVLQSAGVWMAGRYLDLLNPSGQLLYNAANLSTLICRATFSHTELVERVWLCGKTDSEFDRLELFWSDEENAFVAEGRLGTQSSPSSALWIEFDEKTRSIEETANDVQGELTVDHELTYTPKENPNNPYSYAPDPDLGEAVQAQAVSDWEKYVELVNGGLYEMEEEDTVAALEELFGEDDTWDLPAVTDGEHHFSMNYGYDPETVARKLASAEAFTVRINGEKRKVLIELEEENGDLYICYYGLGDLFIPAVPETGEPMMAAAGSLWAGLKDFVKRYWEDGMEVKEKYDEYGWIGEGLLEELNKDPEGGDAGDGDPCSGSGTGGQTREERRKQVDEIFDGGKEAAKAVAEGISMTAGAMGLESSILGEFITQDGGVVDAMFELQKNRIHEHDDALDEMNEDAFADKPADPCKEEEPAGGGSDKDKKDKDRDREHPKLGYQPVYPLVDPSGYLYQGAPGYPAEGVKAHLYYRESDGETWTLWNSEDYGQGPNPYPSESSGYYGWDVLPGKWKVVFEGEGFARAESIELDVPPPHLDVDILMTSTRNPAVADAAVRADGSIYLRFDHLMTVESILSGSVVFTLGGEPLTGTLEAVDQTVTVPGIKQAALDTDAKTGAAVASVFRFVPDDVLLAGMTVEISVDGTVLGYNGLPLQGDWADRLTVPAQDTAMSFVSLERTREDEIYLRIGETETLNADDWRAVYSDGFGGTENRSDVGIRWRSTDESVALVNETGKITAAGGGIASVIGEFEGKTVAFGVSVSRAPVTADAAANTVRFCREQNLVLGKACYMWSEAANFRLDDPEEGDEKYMPVAWRIKEGGAVQAEDTVPAGESAVKVIYTPTALGTLTGEIDYQKYICTGGKWVSAGGVKTAVREIAVTEITALDLNTAPGVTGGKKLDLSDMLIDIHLSDGSVSTVGYSKLASYGITMNLNHGDLLEEGGGVLVLNHGRTGLTLRIGLGTPVDQETVTALWQGASCTVTLNILEPGVSVVAVSYDESGRMTAVKYLTVMEPSVVLTGDKVKVLFLNGDYVPVREALEKEKP